MAIIIPRLNGSFRPASPRQVLKSCWPPDHLPLAARAASSRPASTDSRTRRIVASPGGRNRRASGSNRTPSSARTPGGASAAHSAIAVNDRAPDSTAATDVSRTGASEWRTPAGDADQARPPGIPAGQRTRQAAHSHLSRRAALEQGVSGMMSGQARSSAAIMGRRHSHDLGSRACFVLATPYRLSGHQPVITPL